MTDIYLIEAKVETNIILINKLREDIDDLVAHMSLYEIKNNELNDRLNELYIRYGCVSSEAHQSPYLGLKDSKNPQKLYNQSALDIKGEKND